MKDLFTRKWILEHGIPIAESYNGNITLRALHYRLVADHGMTNDTNHYKAVVGAMTTARWDGSLAFDAFIDHERESLGKTDFEITDVESSLSRAKQQIKLWGRSHRKNRWENQPIYPEVFIEKKALIGAFETTCNRWNIALNPCKGYPSITFLYDACKRFQEAEGEGKECMILYFGDYDPSGEDIPRSVKESLSKMGVDVEVKRILLMKHQVQEWNLPPAPTKMGDSRSAAWDGLGQVELDAIEPRRLARLCEDAIKVEFDQELFTELQEQEVTEKEEFKQSLKADFDSLLDDED